MERFRKAVMGARLIAVHGRIQRHEDIIHIVSMKLEDRSDWLRLLNECPAGRAEPGSARNPTHGWAGHPRNERVIPKSRDFH